MKKFDATFPLVIAPTDLVVVVAVVVVVVIVVVVVVVGGDVGGVGEAGAFVPVKLETISRLVAAARVSDFPVVVVVGSPNAVAARAGKSAHTTTSQQSLRAKKLLNIEYRSMDDRIVAMNDTSWCESGRRRR